jgi:esterase/lipase
MGHTLQHVGPIYLSTLLAMLRSCEEMKRQLHTFEHPMLVIRAGADTIVCNDAIYDLYKKSSSPDK